MANNRLWLGCIEKRLCILLGKDMSDGTYKPVEQEALNDFYNICHPANCEDFILFTENNNYLTATCKYKGTKSAQYNIRNLMVSGEDE